MSDELLDIRITHEIENRKLADEYLLKEIERVKELKKIHLYATLFLGVMIGMIPEFVAHLLSYVR